MNWYKTIANTVYIVYMVINTPLILITVRMLPQDNYWLILPAVIGIFIYIWITLALCYYYILPDKSKIYWHD